MHWVCAHGDCQPLPAGLPTLRFSSVVPDRLALVRLVDMVCLVQPEKPPTHRINEIRYTFHERERRLKTLSAINQTTESFHPLTSSLDRMSFFIEGSGWFERLTLANLGDLSDSLAKVVSIQVDLNPDPISFGDLLLLQDVGIGHRYCPGLSVPRLECDRPLGLIDTYNRTCKGGRCFTGEDSPAYHAEQIGCRDCDPSLLHFVHCAPP